MKSRTPVFVFLENIVEMVLLPCKPWTARYILLGYWTVLMDITEN